MDCLVCLGLLNVNFFWLKFSSNLFTFLPLLIAFLLQSSHMTPIYLKWVGKLHIDLFLEKSLNLKGVCVCNSLFKIAIKYIFLHFHFSYFSFSASQTFVIIMVLQHVFTSYQGLQSNCSNMLGNHAPIWEALNKLKKYLY